ncbi:hypothetical protein GGI09_005439 [Coemansia sp. S100]|nr:hypothetical protein GGI09_005439 [Coemansia sp. S100]
MMMLRRVVMQVKANTRSLTLSRALLAEFPLSQPSWSVGVLLQRPASISHLPEAEQALGSKEIQHLYNLAGLHMPDPATNPQDYAQVLTDINQLRDFLSHLRVVSESEDLSLVEPLARISEPVLFTADSPDAGLQVETDRKTHLGANALKAAAQISGPYFVVED